MKARLTLILLALLLPASSAPSSGAPVRRAPSDVPAASIHVQPGSAQKVCQLTGDVDRERGQNTLNRTHERFRVWGTDLGSSFVHDGRTYFLFGDTWGVHGEGGDSIAFSTDSDPEDCVALDFVVGGDGTYLPPSVPGVSLGSYEVPAGGFSVNGKMYVVFTTDHSITEGIVKMGRSVLARSTDGAQTFQYLYDLSVLSAGGKFINAAPVAVDNADIPGLPRSSGKGVLLWGSGDYRRSPTYLATIPANDVEQRSAVLYFAGMDSETGLPLWSGQEALAVPLTEQACVGELSVAWNPFLSKWLMLYNCDVTGNAIWFHVADQPWGPWSKGQILYNPRTDPGLCEFIHVSWDVLNCDSVHDPWRAGESGAAYGPYLIPQYTTGRPGLESTIHFVMSTWNPYNTVLMKAKLIVEKGPPRVFLPLVFRQ